MSNVFFILLLAVGFAGWKALDHFQLPNTIQYFIADFDRTFWHFMVLSPFRRDAETSSSNRTSRTTFRQSVNG